MLDSHSNNDCIMLYTEDKTITKGFHGKSAWVNLILCESRAPGIKVQLWDALRREVSPVSSI